MDNNLALKKQEILPFITTQMDLEDIMLSDINQTQENKYCKILYVESKIIKHMKTESKTVVSQEMEGDGNGEVFIKEYKVPVIKNK